MTVGMVYLLRPPLLKKVNIMKSPAAVFEAPTTTFYADTCEPLKHAAAQNELRVAACGRGSYPGLALPMGTLHGLCSVGVWDADRHQSWGLDWHRNEGIELTYLARGKLAFAVDGQEHLLKRGELTITRPWQLHRVGLPYISASRLLWLILDVGVRRPSHTWRWPAWLVLSNQDRADLTRMLSQNEQPVWQANDEVEQYFEQLAGVLARYRADGTDETRIALAVNGLLVGLLDLLRRSAPVLDRVLSSTYRTVELFLASLPYELEQPWTLDTMAAACGLGRSRFTHYCRHITNMSPREYLAEHRVAAAARLLVEQRDLSVTEIAIRCGFNSSQYFASVFHQHMRCSPREYRRHHTARSDSHLENNVLHVNELVNPEAPTPLGAG